MIFLKKQTNKQQNKTKQTLHKKSKTEDLWKNSNHETEITNIFFFKQQ